MMSRQQQQQQQQQQQSYLQLRLFGCWIDWLLTVPISTICSSFKFDKLVYTFDFTVRFCAAFLKFVALPWMNKDRLLPLSGNIRSANLSESEKNV